MRRKLGKGQQVNTDTGKNDQILTFPFDNDCAMDKAIDGFSATMRMLY